MITNTEIGKINEQKAKDFLVQKGYKFLDSNFRSGRNEIDLIFEFENKIIFVEVKYRKSKYFGNPEEFVDSKKLQRLTQAAENYLLKINWQQNIRFDIIAITDYDILHLEDVS
jgi:putative endonuclease